MNLKLTVILFLLVFTFVACVPDANKKCAEDQVMLNGMCQSKGIPIVFATPEVKVTPKIEITPPIVEPQKSCGTSLHGSTESRIAYSLSSVPYGQNCSNYQQSQTRTCNNGSWTAWSGVYTYSSCTVQAASSCGSIVSGAYEIRTMYQASSVSEGSSCVSETQSRKCTNGQFGNWSGSYTKFECTMSRIRYENATAPSGGVCKSETQIMSCVGGVCGVWTPNHYVNNTCSLDTNSSSTGWTTFIPSADTRIMYVSLTGNDSTAQVYNKSSVEVGADPFKPIGAIRPYATYLAAYANTREGYSDWILFKRGDIFYQAIEGNVRSGRSELEPFLIGAYGNSGLSPVLKIGAKNGISIMKANSHHGTLQNIAVLGLKFYSHTRNPSDPEYVDGSGSQGISVLAYGLGNIIKNLLIEGCVFQYAKGNHIQGSLSGVTENVKVRRSVFLNSYSTDSHSQGLYSHGVNGFVVEENIFDHNGWLIQQTEGSGEKSSGQATIFNHNTYFSGVKNVTLKGNIFLRPSSMHNKFTANDGVASAGPIAVLNNLYVDGEIGISLGGNVDGEYRFKDIKIMDNVMTDMNLSRPTSRTIAWAIGIQDWDGGQVSNNYIINTDHGNSYAFSHSGTSRNVTIENNHVYNFKNISYVFKISGAKGDNVSNMVFSNNKFQVPSSYKKIISADYATTGKWTFTGNQYYSERLDNTSFYYNQVAMSAAAWKTSSGDNALIEQISLPANMPSVPEYMLSIGETGTLDAFIAKCRAQDRFSWDTRFTSEKVNAWIRSAYAPK